MPTHRVGPGESATSIAAKHGFFVDTVWNHPDNADLRAKRKTPDVLYQGDELFIPEKSEKKEEGATSSRHRFKVKGVPARFRLQLLAGGKPRAGEDYVFEVEGKSVSGKTDGDGWVDQPIHPKDRRGRLLLGGGKEEIPIRIGGLDPIEELSGVQQRLNHLGYPAGQSGQLDDRTKSALRRFQSANQLEVTGEADDATRSKLSQLHD